MKHPNELDYKEFSTFRFRILFYHVLLVVSYVWVFSEDKLYEQAGIYFITNPMFFYVVAWICFVWAIYGCIKEVFRSFHITRDQRILQQRYEDELDAYERHELGENEDV